MSPGLDWNHIQQLKHTHRNGPGGNAFAGFTRRYRHLLNDCLSAIEEESRAYLEKHQQQTACRQGCVSCCSQFVSVNVAHALLVVNYLYDDEILLEYFLKRYRIWRKSFSKKSTASTILNQLENYTTRSAVVCSYPQELCSAYHRLEIACPFLKQGSCSIHAIRPIVCAAYFSLTDAEYCRPDSATPPLILEITPPRELLMEMDGLIKPQFHLHQESLPDLVYKLMTRGMAEVSKELEYLFAAR